MPQARKLQLLMSCNYDLSVPHLCTCVNRTSLVRFPQRTDRLSCSSRMRSIRQPACLVAAVLALSSALLAQQPSMPSSQTAAARQDTRRAQKAAERGAKAEAAGRLAEALAAYQEAASDAPQDAAVVGHAAALRSKLVRLYTEAAERDALGGHLDRA